MSDPRAVYCTGSTFICEVCDEDTPCVLSVEPESIVISTPITCPYAIIGVKVEWRRVKNPE